MKKVFSVLMLFIIILLCCPIVSNAADELKDVADLLFEGEIEVGLEPVVYTVGVFDPIEKNFIKTEANFVPNMLEQFVDAVSMGKWSTKITVKRVYKLKSTGEIIYNINSGILKDSSIVLSDESIKNDRYDSVFLFDVHGFMKHEIEKEMAKTLDTLDLDMLLQIPDRISRSNQWQHTIFTEKAGKIIGNIRNIGIVAGVIALSGIGLRYMFASVEEKAEYKETMMPFMIGAVLLIAGSAIVSFIYSVAVSF